MPHPTPLPKRLTMSNSPKLLFYRLARRLGMFAAARFLTRRRVCILAYHGFAQSDEAQFRGKLFISPDTFGQRLDLLKRRGYKVLRLGQALQQLQQGQVQADAVVITIDDGYASTLSVAGPLLRAHDFPATVYLTSYHMLTQTPVYDLIIAYLVWKARLPLARLVWPVGTAPQDLDLATPLSREGVVARLTEDGHRLAGEAGRMALARALAEALALDFDSIVATEAFRLLTPAEARLLPALGVEIGLHTHRHRFPPGDLASCRREIDDNRAYLARESVPVTPHFCYPSGVYDPGQWAVLADAGLASATTCDTGLVRSGDARFGLQRFLDGEMVDEVEFEAEISGFADLLRALLRVDRRSLGAGSR